MSDPKAKFLDAQIHACPKPIGGGFGSIHVHHDIENAIRGPSQSERLKEKISLVRKQRSQDDGTVVIALEDS